jgi:hypothetical protein
MECVNCNKETANPKFCSRSCSAAFANKSKPKRKAKLFSCVFCNKTKPYKKSGILYCSQKCRNDSKVKLWLDGKDSGYTGKAKALKKFIRAYIFKTRGTACSECGWDKKHPDDGLPLTEIDHKNGNAENCSPDNLRVLCPNCHSMTSTFRARNKNSTRNR